MCLAFVGLNCTEEFPFFAAFNRDEVYCRATRAAHWWEDSPEILAGRDLERGGTWAGVTRSGRVGMLTFVRTPRSGTGERSKRSRGQIVVDFLQAKVSAAEFVSQLEANGAGYLPYNVILGEIGSSFVHFSNVVSAPTVLRSGISGLSNASLETPWPKVVEGKRKLAAWIESGANDLAPVFRAMRDAHCYADQELPQTGVPIERERAVSAAFIEDGDYGTRTTTVLRASQSGDIELIEVTHRASESKSESVRFEWNLTK